MLPASPLPWRPLTCRDDADSQRAGHQPGVGAVLVHAVVGLGPTEQTVEDLTEHPVSPHTHHPGEHTHARTHTYVHMHIHTYIHTYTYTQDDA